MEISKPGGKNRANLNGALEPSEINVFGKIWQKNK